MDLWQQRIGEDGDPRGEPEPVTTGLGIRAAAFAPDGTKLAYSRGGIVGNVWRVPLLTDRRATWDDAEQLTFDQANVTNFDLSPDGRTLVLASDRAGHQSLWTLPSDGGEMAQVSFGSAPDLMPEWSPDGTEIAFFSWRSGNRDLWVMPANGGPPRPLAAHPEMDLFPKWSPDGSKISFSSTRSGNYDLWVIPSQGGEPSQLTDHPAIDQNPVWSPDGQWLAFESWREGRIATWRMRAEGGSAELLTERRGRASCWSADSSKLFFKHEDGLWAYSMEDGTERALTELMGRPGRIGGLWMDTDGEFLYFVWREDLGDIWVMDVVQEND